MKDCHINICAAKGTKDTSQTFQTLRCVPLSARHLPRLYKKSNRLNNSGLKKPKPSVSPYHRRAIVL